jgi:DNA invertase Pin-like site-specific DNA recombinase
MKKRKKIAPHLEIPTSLVKWAGRKKGDPMMVGYARVSTRDQNNQRQIDELVRYGVAPVDIFQDKKSGKTTDRPGWKNCFRELQRDDLLVIYSLDRLGRNLGDLIDIEQELYKKGVKLKIIQQDINTGTASGRMIFHMIGALAQWERDNNWDRTNHGLKSAKERGRIGGQPSPYTDKEIRAAIKKGGSDKGAAALLKCKPITIKRRRDMWKEGRKLKLPVAA